MMNENRDKSNFMSVLLILFTGVICVMVLFALASSASVLAQVITFILALIAFLFFVALAIYNLNQQENDIA